MVIVLAGVVNMASNDFTYDLAKFIDFQDKDACERVRAIKKKDIAKTDNPNLKIKVIDSKAKFYKAFAVDLVGRIEKARDESKTFVAIVPVGPVPQYEIAAKIINKKKISMEHVHFFNMDEYADQDGNTAPISWAGSFQKAMYDNFLLKIDKKLRPKESQLNFPTTAAISSYTSKIEDLGGADVCYGGIGWCGHIAFWESDLGKEFRGDHEAFRNAGPRTVELTPMTVMQNALHTFGGDWSWVPPKANTIGPVNILTARDRSFWLDGYLGGGVSWQRFIARLVLHGPVSEFVPGSFLQTVPSKINILGGVADDLEINMA